MDIFEKTIELKKSNNSFVIATVVKATGSTPGKVGFKMIVEKDLKTTGTVGGGAIEMLVKEEAIERLQKNNNGLAEYILTDKANEENTNGSVVQMSCEGKIWIYYECISELPIVYVFGGGHVGNALLYHLKPLGFHTILIDNRETLASKEKNPDAAENIFSDYLEFAKNFNPSENSYVVILTQQHIYDYDVAKILYQRKLKLKYIGIIASKSKAAGIKSKLIKELVDVNLSNLHTPIGLNIGGDSASEIALTIAAQIQMTRYEKKDIFSF